MIGTSLSPEELFNDIAIDSTFFSNSGGGVTVSGGEPTMQAEFCEQFMQLCKGSGISTAIETNLNCSQSTIDRLLPVADLWMCDLKLADRQKHILFTGASNERTIHNLEYLSENNAKIVVRTPVIPGVNDSEEEITAICRILSKIRIEYYELLPFHSMGFYKFPTIGVENPMKGAEDMNNDKLASLYETVRSCNIKTR